MDDACSTTSGLHCNDKLLTDGDGGLMFLFKKSTLLTCCLLFMLTACGSGGGGGNLSGTGADTSCVVGSSNIGDCTL